MWSEVHREAWRACSDEPSNTLLSTCVSGRGAAGAQGTSDEGLIAFLRFAVPCDAASGLGQPAVQK